MTKLYFYVLAGGLLLPGRAAWAQQPAPGTVSGDFRGLRFEQFVQRLETQLPYRFYYNPAATDTVTVRLQARDLPLEAALTQALEPAHLSFAIDEATRRVYVTTGHPLQTQVPESYFQPGGAPPPPVADDAPATNQAAVAGTSEFKLYEVGTRPAAATGKATLTGVVRLADSGKPAVGVAVYVEAPSVGTATDREGRYSLSLPPGRYNLNIRGMGVRSSRRQVALRGSGQLDLVVAADAAVLNEVVVEGQRDRNVRSVQMGVQTLDIKTIKQVPTVFGEADILRVVMALPGVKTVGEGSTGMSVRGGGTDQNLVLYNDAVIYNPAHLFGFFSAFNPDVIKSVDLYKSAIPVRYGGRLSSVLDIQGREGKRTKFGGSGGIGPLTSRLALEGPLGSTNEGTEPAKGSFIVGGRASYSDWLLHLVPNASLQNSAASFYDLNALVTYDFDPHNSVAASGYYSRDRFRLASDTVYNYHNTAASLKWKHDFTDKLQAYFTGAYSSYDFGLSTTRNPYSASTFDYAINQSSVQAHFNYLAHARHVLDFGGSSLLYNTQPGRQVPLGDDSRLLPVSLQHERAVESAVYASERFDISPRFSVQAGLRYSFFQALGPRTVTNYLDGISRSESTVTGTTTYSAGQALANYSGPEWRFSTRLELTAHSSVKASLTRMRQYVHQLSNTTVVSPTDSWKLSDNYIRPQVGDQVSLGYYHNFKRNTVEFSVEGYYKRTHDFLDYKSGAVLLLNPHLETDLVNAEGRAYGVEVLLRKNEGKINGWLSYTYARSLVQVNTATDVVNNGDWYPSNYDKPNDVTLVGNYRFSRRFNLSLNFNYSTGRPITLPLAKYFVDNALRVYYSDRNAYRVPDYYRVDFAVNFEGNHKVKKLAHSSWTVAVYNVLGRHNPYSVYFQTVNGQIRGYKLSIFGEPIPTVTYNFRF